MTRRHVAGSIGMWLALALAIPCGFGQDSKVDESTFDAKKKALLQRLRDNTNTAGIAREFEMRLLQAQREVESYKKGYIIVGRVALEKGQDPRYVQSQMIILENGYFVDAIGQANKPIGFRLHGHEAVNIIPKGPGPIEPVGTVRLKVLPKNRLASAKGQVQIEEHPDAPGPSQVEVSWQITADPINTPSNGTEGTSGFSLPPIKSRIGDDGGFSVSGMSPAKYYLAITAPNCVNQWRYVDFAEGERKELEPIKLEVIRKFDVEFAVSADGDFGEAKVQKKTLAANDRWRVNDKTPQYGWDLEIGQKDGKLLLKYSYAPCFIYDLGAATLADKLSAGTTQSTRPQPLNVPVEDGHVYLVDQRSWKHWILFRATLPK